MSRVSTISKDAIFYVAGHRGLVGRAIVRRLVAQGYQNILTRTSEQLDLTEQSAVKNFFATERPQYVFLTAARVGGIRANETRPAEFIFDNLMIATNTIDAAWRFGAQRLLFFGTACGYPKLAPQPMDEQALLTGALEPSNEPYAVAKIAGIKMCESYNRQYGTDFRAVMPANLYGPGDHFGAQNGHVIAALIARMHEAKRTDVAGVPVWGSGRARREFLFVEDLADACLYVMGLDRAKYFAGMPSTGPHINVGAGYDVSISELARTIAEVVGYRGQILFDATKPEGAPRKLLDSSALAALGWRSKTGLREGLEATYQWYLQTVCDAHRTSKTLS